MTKIYITYRPSWIDSMLSWTTSKYSPNFTNSQKIETNLKKIGSMNRFEWRQNMQLIKNAIAPAVLNNILYIHVEKLKIDDCCIVLSMTIDVPHQSKFFCDFILSSTLNLHSISFVNKIIDTKNLFIPEVHGLASTNIPINKLKNTNSHHHQKVKYTNESTENGMNCCNILIDAKKNEDDDDLDNEKFLYAIALKEPPKATAEKALNNGLEWYSFFLPKLNEEEASPNNNPFEISSTLACTQKNG